MAKVAITDSDTDMHRNPQCHRPPGFIQSVCDKILYIFDCGLHIEGNNKMTQKVFRSTQAVELEKIRQKEENRFIIHPFSLFRWYWDLVMVVTLICTLLLLPVEIAFYSDEGEAHNWMAVNIMVDVVFLIDIAFNFRTGYLQVGVQQVQREKSRFMSVVQIGGWKVALNYLKTWFFLDLVSSVPLDYLYKAFSGLAEDTPDDQFYMTLRILRFTKLLSLLRILRIARLMRYIYKLEEILDLNQKVINIFNLVALMLVFCHWNGCIQYLVSFMEGFPEQSWVIRDGLVEVANETIIISNTTTIWRRYSRSLWRAMSHMMSIGYGHHPPVSTTDTWMVILSMSLGVTFYALFVGLMSNLIMSLDFSGKKYDEMVCEVKQYMKFRHIPVKVQERVLDYYEHKYQRKFFDEPRILLSPALLSEPLRRDILMHNCRAMVSKVPFLANAPIDFLYDLIRKLEFQVYFPGDHIITALPGGRKGDSMFFIEHGLVEIQIPDGTKVNELGDGNYFGEIALLMDERRTASVIAIEISDMYCLRKADFIDVVSEYPDMKKVLQVMAEERMKEIQGGNVLSSPIGTATIEASSVEHIEEIL